MLAAVPALTVAPSRSPRSDASGADPLLDGDVDDEDEDGGNQKREDQAVREQHQVAILKQINRVNEDGSYTFGYEAADGSFKIETRDVLGHVKGMFGFIDEQGQLKRVSYTAANGTGFQADPTPASPGVTVNGAPTGQQPLPGAVYQQSFVRVAEFCSEFQSSGQSFRVQVIRPLARRRPSAVRLVVPPGTASTASTTDANGRAHVIQQIPRRVRPLQQADGSILSTVSPSSTTTASTASSRASVRPVLVLATPAPGADGSTPTPAPYGQYVRRAEHPARRPVLVLGSIPAASTTTTTTAAPVTEDNASEGDFLRRI
ncbi:uncharacterized protein LOC117647486 [Thrips palmi]|uniref:Uncharacterized protein LOC117647486 n=1 Tax=Thrips palmi TaxID=161013 RepID=A0A6P8YYA0_THRPL|nr:uncharacterized protein LOC117647486 [Thrips palmi]